MEKLTRHIPDILLIPYEIVRDIVVKFRKSNCNHLAASISFFTLLSLIPFILLLASVAGFIITSNQELHHQIMEFMTRVIPTWQEASERSIDFLGDNQSILGFVGIITMLITSRSLLSSMNFAFDTILDVEDTKGSLRLYLDTVLVLISFLTLVAASFFLNIGYNAILELEIFRELKNHIVSFGSLWRYVSSWLISGLLFFVFYRFLPSKHLDLSVVGFSAGIAAAFWELGKSIFSLYLVLAIERYKFIYGSVSSIIFAILWAYLFGLSLVTGLCTGIVFKDKLFPDKHGFRISILKEKKKRNPSKNNRDISPDQG